VIENVKIYLVRKVIYINRILHCNIAMYWDLINKKCSMLFWASQCSTDNSKNIINIFKNVFVYKSI